MDSSNEYPGNGSSPPGVSEISLVEIANVLLRHRRLLVALPIALAVVFGGRALLGDRSYVASASFFPQGAGAGTSPATNLARQFGLDVGSSRPGQSPEFYAELLRGREVLRKAVETEYTIPGDDGIVRTMSLIEFWNVEAKDPSPAWSRASDVLARQLTTRVDRQTGIVGMTVSASSPALAEQVAERLLELLNDFNLETRQSQAREEGRFVASRLEEARDELHAAEAELQAFLRQNRQFENSPELRFDHDRLQRQVSMRQELVNSLAQAWEQARIEGVRDTPVLTVFATPEGSAVPLGRGVVRRAALGLLLGGLLATFVAFSREFGRRNRAENGDEYREYDRLKREALADVRHPRRLLAPLFGGRRTSPNA